ncbi:MAG: ORF6N domain-containing protein [Bacteroidales bacterium]|nr:ORF6N domain-containing protein [Bacteroidales bacterium]
MGIFTLRGQQVLLDRDLAALYSVETKVLNQAVKRNIERFPPDFRFQLTKDEFQELITNCDRFASLKHSATLPFAFNEQGVPMLSCVLKSETAIKVSINIIRAFVAMRQFLSINAQLYQRMATSEEKQEAVLLFAVGKRRGNPADWGVVALLISFGRVIL